MHKRATSLNVMRVQSAVSESAGRTSLGRRIVLISIWLLAFLSAGLLIALPLNVTTALPVEVGQPAPQTLLAPATVTFVSDELTNLARQQAADAVADVYDPPRTGIARQQILRLRDVIELIDDLRASEDLPLNDKIDQITSQVDMALGEDQARQILALSEDSWITTQNEALLALERIMQGQVRADQLDQIRRAAPALLSIDISDQEAEIAMALVRPLIIANSLYNDAATREARQAARDAVAPVERTVVRGQTVITRGQVVSAADLEMLTELGLLEIQTPTARLIGAIALTVIGAALTAAYVWRFRPELGRSLKVASTTAVLSLFFLLVTQIAVREPEPLPYLLPAAALAMLLTAIVGLPYALLVMILFSGGVSLMADGDLVLTAYTLLTGVTAAVVLGKAERLNLFFWSGLASAAVGAATLIAGRAVEGLTDPIMLSSLAGAAVISGGASTAFTLLALFAVGGLFGFTTSLQLVELARPDHPLLRFLLRNAPGSYQHSLQVANLAEQAAELIGISPMLMRVAALYHDCGKALNPQFFIENQLDHLNVHDQLDPETSAHYIIRHVEDGLMLASRYRLPPRLRDFIAEHHGTMMAKYQYARALEAIGGDPAKVERSRFTYPGPRPRSRETALLMLADGCEAKTRADRPQNEEDIERVVQSLIDDRILQGQLDDADLTLRELAIIRTSFISTLRGLYHPRLRYPESIASNLQEPQTPVDSSPTTTIVPVDR